MIIDNGHIEVATSVSSLDEYGATIAAQGEAVAYPCQYEQQAQNYGARVENVNYVSATYLILLEGDRRKEIATEAEVTLFDAYQDVIKSGAAQSVEYLFAVGLTKIIL